MTSAVVSSFFDFDVMNKNKLLGFNNNLAAPNVSGPCPGSNLPLSPGPRLDRTAVGAPSATFQRRHSVSSTKFSQNQFINPLNPLKALDHPLNPLKALDHPLKALDHPLNPLKALDHPLNPLKALDHPLKALDHPLNPLNPLDHPLSPLKALDYPLKALKALDHPLNPLKALDHPLNPLKALDHPLKALDHPLNPLKALDHPLDHPLLSGLSSNKENRLRERSFSETGERLLNKYLTPPSPTGGPQVNSSRYKTELCRPFEENGSCKYGDKCQFAHGLQELRSLSRHPKYKTDLCRTFHTIGFCPYGPRCHFIHNAEERRGPPQSLGCTKERPRLQHSYSFAGFSSCSLRDSSSPTSLTPPPTFFTEELPQWPSSNPFTYSSQELVALFGPMGSEPSGPPSPTIAPYCFRPMVESPNMFEAPCTPPDSLSDQESYQSSCGSLSGSESPTLDSSRRLPIFSRLSISDD